MHETGGKKRGQHRSSALHQQVQDAHATQLRHEPREVNPSFSLRCLQNGHARLQGFDRLTGSRFTDHHESAGPFIIGDQTAPQGSPSPSIENDPPLHGNPRRSAKPRLSPRCQTRIVCQNRLNANQDGVDTQAQMLGMGSRLRTRDPLRFTRSGGDLAVESHGRLSRHPRNPMHYPVVKCFVDPVGFCLKHARINRDPRFP